MFSAIFCALSFLLVYNRGVESRAQEGACTQKCHRWATNLLSALEEGPPTLQTLGSPKALLTMANFVDRFLWWDQEISCGTKNSQGRRTGIQLPADSWPQCTNPPTPGGQTPKSSQSRAPVPNLVYQRRLSQRRIESCHRCLRNSLCCPVERGHQRD